jgi:hypothetical protein
MKYKKQKKRKETLQVQTHFLAFLVIGSMAPALKAQRAEKNAQTSPICTPFTKQ